MTLFTYSVPRLGASSFAILANTELVVVVSIGVLVLGEAMTPWRAVGGALIVTGIVAHVLARRPTQTRTAAEIKPSAAAARRARELERACGQLAFVARRRPPQA